MRTDYNIKAEIPVLSADLITKLSTQTGLAQRQAQMFDEEVTVTTLSNTQIVVHVPSTDPKLCTEYMSLFLKWLDTEYFSALSTISEYEEPILQDDQ